ncbi:mechanosensitive ion channel [Candidatus Marinimicrobia bacterium]|nr:mechanosensitive ion channel [Candidatus Neomarinimicrobiota bacterium]
MENISQIILELSTQKYIIFISIILLGIISYLITRYIIIKIIFHFFEKTSTKIDDILIEKGFLNRLSYVVPLLIIYNLSDNLMIGYEMINRLLLSVIITVLSFSFNSLINVINEIYNRSKYSKSINIKSYFQILKLIINLLSIIVVIAVLSGKSPFYLLSGIGALTAVLMLVFKDTILSLVSSIQINSNDLFKIGDWIEAPLFGADGDVIDIALHNVKIQNWDKTISIIPTYKLIDSSFKNWRGMSISGGRRIKRSICIDMNSIKFCSDEMINQYKKINVITGYINSKVAELKDYNKTAVCNNSEVNINGRSLTNIGTYRAYIKGYLKNNINIHKDMTFLVRQLSITDKGLPIEIYVFTNTTDWIEYEEIQSDIFDHLISSLAQFDLKVFQNPSGNDLSNLKM